MRGTVRLRADLQKEKPRKSHLGVYRAQCTGFGLSHWPALPGKEGLVAVNVDYNGKAFWRYRCSLFLRTRRVKFCLASYKLMFM